MEHWRNPKILSLEKLILTAQKLKRQGKKIVTYNGSFDIIQVGHIKSIQEAKKQGDVLFILLNSDVSIRSYKGPNRPIVPEIERAELVAGIEGVDYVGIFHDINPTAVLDRLKPNVHCNGPEWGKNCIEREVVEKHGGIIFVTKTKRVSSTTQLIGKIVKVYKEPTVKAVFLDRDGTINDDRQGYIFKKQDLVFLPKVPEALRMLSKSSYKIIIVTNQSGIGRRYFTQREYDIFNKWMLVKLNNNGVRIDDVYRCPHHPNKKCDCRKPQIGMLLRAVKDHQISLNDSWLIGNSESDVIAGRKANVRTIKLGQHMDNKLKLEPNYYASNILEAVKIVLG